MNSSINTSRGRKRGVILTPDGYRRLQEAKATSELRDNLGSRYSLAALSDRTGLAQRTVVKALDREVRIDRSTLEQLFQAFGLELLRSDYTMSSTQEISQVSEPTVVRIDWGDAPEMQSFFGRSDELQFIENCLVTDCCQLVLLFGMGGIGKTSIAFKLTKSVQRHFEFVIWRSLRHAPPACDILTELIKFISCEREVELPESIGDKLTRLISHLREHRCLLVLDNIETILDSGERSRQFREGFEDYEFVIRQLGELPHRSSVLMTSREKPRVVGKLESLSTKVRALQINGLCASESQQIIELHGLPAHLLSQWQMLIDHYVGNPLALKMAAATVRNLFDGDVEEFLRLGVAVFGDIRELLTEQLTRMSELEEEVMFWLAINRLPSSLTELQQDILAHISKPALLESLESLVCRSLVERRNSSFTLQPLVMEYLTDRLIEQIYEELVAKEISLLNRYALLKAQGADHIQGIQIRLLITPILQKLITVFGSAQGAEQHLLGLLDQVRVSVESPGYAGGSLINMLRQLRGELSHCDFSDITIRQADLRGVNLHGTNFARAILEQSAFTETLSNISAVNFSPDSQLLATGDGNGTVFVWNVKDGRQQTLFQGHMGWVWSVAFSPNGAFLASAGADQTVRLWDVATGQCLRVFQGHTNWVFSVVFSPNGSMLATSSLDQSVRLWSVTTGECLQEIQGHEGGIWSIAFSPDGKTLATGSLDSTIRLWQVVNGQCCGVMLGHSGWIYSVAFSPDGRTLVSGSADQTVRLWDISSRSCRQILTGHTDWVHAVAFAPDGLFVASGSHDRSVRLWEVESGHCRKVLSGHTNWVISVAFSPDGCNLASGSADQTVRLWETNAGHCHTVLCGFSNWIWSVACSPDSRFVLTGGSDQAAHVWQIETGQCVRSLWGHSNWVHGVAFSPHGNTAATGSADQTVRLWDVPDGKCRRVLHGHTAWVWSVAFEPDGTVLASASADRTVRLWDVATGQCLRVLQGHDDWVHTVMFSPDSQLLASSSVDRTVRLWDTNTGLCQHILRGHTSVVRSVAFSPRGHWLASVSQDATVRLWNIVTGKCIRTFPEPPSQKSASGIWSVAFSPNGQMLATGSEDGILRLWDFDSGACCAVLPGHSDPIWSVVFSPDGNTVVTGSQDGTALLWDVPTRRCVHTLRSARPYEGMNIIDIAGLSEVEKANLRSLGAVEVPSAKPSQE
jgi:WD40 repeat protein